MTPARSLAASVVALGFASALTAPQPALAAPAPCEQAENFAAQSGAELLRIDKLEVRTSTADRPRVKNDRDTEDGTVTGAANRVLNGDDSIIPDPEDSDTLSEGIGMLGTGALGYLGGLPKRAVPAQPKANGDADMAPAAKGSLTGDVAEHGSAAVDRLTEGHGSAGAGAGEPVDDDSRVQPGGNDRSRQATDSDRRAPQAGDTDRRAPQNGDSGRGAPQNGDSGRGAPRTGDEGPQQVGDVSRAPSDRRARTGGDRARTSMAALTDVGVGEARTAMIATAPVASAAYARMLDGRARGKSAATTKPLLQQAPPTNAQAARRSTPAGKAGPLRLGDGRMSTRAQWDAGMACGRVMGETGRADTSLSSLSLLGHGRDALVRVPGTMTSRGTTALEEHAGEPRTVARSTVTAGLIELAGGQVHVRVLRAPVLETAMSRAGGKVSYRPAVVEISGEGIATKRLTAAGDHVDVALAPPIREMESAPLRNLTELGALGKAEPLPVPAVPGLPPVATPETESAPAVATGVKLRVALGDVRHAAKGQAIAARASAIKVSLSASTSSQGRGRDGYGPQSGVALTMALGVLEAAAVSPESRDVTSSGAGGGLPVTGSDVTRVALVGGGLLLAGAAAILLTLRRRRFRS